MGQNPTTLNILAPEINRMEYIEVFSLLAKAAEQIEDGVTCLELNRYENGPVFEGPQRPAEPARPAAARPARPNKTEKKSRWKALGDKLSSWMSEDDVNDDQ